MAFLLWQGGAISLETRFYQPTIVLLTTLLAVRSFDKSKIWATISRLTLITTMLLGLTLLLYRHIHMRAEKGPYTLASEGLNIVNTPPSVLSSLQMLSTGPNSIIFVEEPRLELDLIINASSTTRFLRVNQLDEWHLSQSRHGRVPHIVLAISERLSRSGLGETLRRSFTDYDEEEWSLTLIEGWQIWEARCSPLDTHRAQTGATI